ncbi:nuclease harbi1 [Lasius niger]|uniref:Nuclease harbi1 n=1 Tax=Lasius niger TaxID=67767 RepID=A0A0J7JUH3_LASNI|nr:nuclease harbi1 [Lasius niger]
MAIYMAAILLLGDEEDDAVEHNQVMRVTRRILRDVSDPFSVPDNEFRKLYRLTKDTNRVLIEELVPFMPEISRKTAIPHELQILASLNFFAAPNFCNDFIFPL